MPTGDPICPKCHSYVWMTDMGPRCSCPRLDPEPFRVGLPPVGDKVPMSEDLRAEENRTIPTKLSIALLADAFTEEEVSEGRVFAIYGKSDTLRTLAEFFRAVHKRMEYPGYVLWGAIYIEDHRLGHLEIQYGVYRHFEGQSMWPTTNDFVACMTSPVLEVKDPVPERLTVWRRRIRLHG